MKYISNAKYREPVETGTIYRGDNKRLDICVHTLRGCGETLYMNCHAFDNPELCWERNNNGKND